MDLLLFCVWNCNALFGLLLFLVIHFLFLFFFFFLSFFFFQSNVRSFLFHYENLPMQYTDILSAVKIENLIRTIFDILSNFVENIDCGYMLEPPHRGGCNEYPQSIFLEQN